MAGLKQHPRKQLRWRPTFNPLRSEAKAHRICIIITHSYSFARIPSEYVKQQLKQQIQKALLLLLRQRLTGLAYYVLDSIKRSKHNGEAKAHTDVTIRMRAQHEAEAKAHSFVTWLQHKL